MTRMSPQPCPYCGEHFELRRGPECGGNPQRHHVQSAWCAAQVDLARKAKSNAKRNEARRRKRETKPLSKRPLRVKNPWDFGVFRSRTNFSWLLRKRPDDALQTIALALLESGVTDLWQPCELDTAAFARTLAKNLYHLGRSEGFFRRFHHTELDEIALSKHAARNWQTVWSAAR